MSTDRWDDDRLDRLADRIEGLTSIAERHDHLIESNARVIQALANVAAEAREERQQILQLIAQQQESMDQKQTVIFQQQEEIRGLQTENRRILDILLNQRNQGDNPTA
jgi:archaellum biogenesis ATPase FlaH